MFDRNMYVAARK